MLQRLTLRPQPHAHDQRQPAHVVREGGRQDKGVVTAVVVGVVGVVVHPQQMFGALPCGRLCLSLWSFIFS